MSSEARKIRLWDLINAGKIDKSLDYFAFKDRESKLKGIIELCEIEWYLDCADDGDSALCDENEESLFGRELNDSSKCSGLPYAIPLDDIRGLALAPLHDYATDISSEFMYVTYNWEWVNEWLEDLNMTNKGGQVLDDYEKSVKFVEESNALAKSKQAATVAATTTQIKKEGNTMETTSKIAGIAGNALNTAKGSASLALQLKLGDSANHLAAEMLAKKAPLLVRGHVTTVYGKAVIAQIACAAVQHFAPDNAKAQAVTQSMANAAMFKLFDEVDLNGFLDEFLGKIQGGAVEKLTEEVKNGSDTIHIDVD